MKKAISILIILITLIISPLMAANMQKTFSGDSTEYQMAYALCISAGVLPPSSVLPITGAEIAEALSRIPYDKLSLDEKAAYDDLMGRLEFTPLHNYDKFGIDPTPLFSFDAFARSGESSYENDLLFKREDRMEAMWDLVYNLMKCPDPDPVASWREYIRNTEKRKKALDSRGYVKYRYRSGRTDLTLSPADEAIWFGGCNRYIDRVFIPNLPTEEIFTVPQKFSAEGHVESTMPLNYDGRMIEGIKIDFHEGKAVSVHADKGEDILREIIASDEGASYLGEFALVDQASRIASSGKILYTTLYDENASCHIALGTAAGQMPEGRDEELGVNRSCVHVDFMIGSDDMTVEAEKADGTWERILVNGRWNDKVFEN